MILGSVLAMVLGGSGSAAVAEDPETITATIRRSTTGNANPNNVTIDVSIIQRATGRAPLTRYGVFLNARQGDAEPILEEPEICVQQNDADASVPRGVYRCSVIVNNPGTWTFTGYINLPGETGQRQLQVLETTFAVADAVVLAGDYKGLRYVVEGSRFEVFLLQAHVVLAVIWLLLAAALTGVALPRLRNILSGTALHTLEVRRSFLTSSLWVAFGGTLITGLWLLNTLAAYEAPFSATSFSWSAYQSITQLPYAAWYFNALYLKIAVFLVMGAASMVLAMEAARQSRTADDTAAGDDDHFDLWTSGVRFDEQGRVRHEHTPMSAVAAGPPRPAPGDPGPRALWMCAGALAGGAWLVGLLVTVLKYCHELIETANAARILGG